MLVARWFVLKGRVQGVGFRFFAQEAAALEGIAGFVRNRGDGGVEAFAEGEREAVERFERRLRRGPAGARVESFDVRDEDPGGRADGFRITS
jgi:acylphosphatase